MRKLPSDTISLAGGVNHNMGIGGLRSINSYYAFSGLRCFENRPATSARSNRLKFGCLTPRAPAQPSTRQPKYQVEVKVLKSAHCTICMSDIDLQKSTTLGCSHQYHRKCIAAWLKHSRKCPVCKKKA